MTLCIETGAHFICARLIHFSAKYRPGEQEVIARAGNYEICKATFDKALFVYPAP
jgi:hypothetical protein